MNNKGLIGIFEEDEVNYKVLSTILKKYNYDFLRIDNLCELEKIARGKVKETCDLVFTNLYFYRGYYKNSVENLTNIPFIALTSTPFEDIRKLASELNYSHIISKPYDLKDILDIVEKYNIQKCKTDKNNLKIGLTQFNFLKHNFLK